MTRPTRDTARHLAVSAAVGAAGATASLAGPDAAVMSAALAPLIENAVDQVFATLPWKRRQRVGETLGDAVAELGGDTPAHLRRIVEAAASDESYQELLARALTIAQDTAMRDKRRALGRALANALDESGTKVDEEIAFVRLLEALDPVHIRVLRIVSGRPQHLDAVAAQMNAVDNPKAARQWYAWSISEADPGLEEAVWGTLRVLEQQGLIQDHGEFPVPAPELMQHEYEITPYGDYLISRLADGS